MGGFLCSVQLRCRRLVNVGQPIGVGAGSLPSKRQKGEVEICRHPIMLIIKHPFAHYERMGRPHRTKDVSMKFIRFSEAGLLSHLLNPFH